MNGPMNCVSRDEVIQALSETKAEKDHRPSDVSLWLTAACRK